MALKPNPFIKGAALSRTVVKPDLFKSSLQARFDNGFLMLLLAPTKAPILPHKTQIPAKAQNPSPTKARIQPHEFPKSSPPKAQILVHESPNPHEGANPSHENSNPFNESPKSSQRKPESRNSSTKPNPKICKTERSYTLNPKSLGSRQEGNLSAQRTKKLESLGRWNLNHAGFWG